MLQQRVSMCHAARDVVVMAAAHQEQVGGRQHGDGNAGTGQPVRDLGQPRRRQGRQLGDMARSEEPSELQSLMRRPYAVFCLKKKIKMQNCYSRITKMLPTSAICISSRNNRTYDT